MYCILCARMHAGVPTALRNKRSLISFRKRQKFEHGSEYWFRDIALHLFDYLSDLVELRDVCTRFRALPTMLMCPWMSRSACLHRIRNSIVTCERDQTVSMGRLLVGCRWLNTSKSRCCWRLLEIWDNWYWSFR